MKRIIIVIAFSSISLIMFSTKVVSQPYQSLFGHGDYATTWTHIWFNLPIGIVLSRYQKDTLVHGITYKKVIATEYYLQSRFSGGLFREDTANGFVWYRDISICSDQSDTLERLAFRFDLEVGDTFNISYSNRSAPQLGDTLSVVDSIRMINGLKYIYFRLKNYVGEPITFIEGVGSNMGIFWKHANTKGSPYFRLVETYLLCSHKNGIKTAYDNQAYDGRCTNVSVDAIGDESKDGRAVILYPQPANGTVWIGNDGGKPVHAIWIYTPQGRLVQDLYGDNMTKFETGGLPAGLYYIKLFSDHGHLAVKPLVID